MTEVKKRRYSSPLRTEQAQASRAAVLAAARELFVEQGYGGTTIDQVAARAGVSKPTVFTAVGNKATLLKVVRDVAMAGDDQPRTVTSEAFAEPEYRTRNSWRSEPYRSVGPSLDARVLKWSFESSTHHSQPVRMAMSHRKA